MRDTSHASRVDIMHLVPAKNEQFTNTYNTPYASRGSISTHVRMLIFVNEWISLL